eukprot:TRINITY_DN21785_c0_g1_i5.p1 TRINITY_DN21785_c0_g1~~TRINITY_DN21785_c0_g1_i5.p1  ORF type:complete len:212 (-),score=11.48 TRINITY_DN21785_c0_g1_i5:132-767(-)
MLRFNSFLGQSLRRPYLFKSVCIRTMSTTQKDPFGLLVKDHENVKTLYKKWEGASSNLEKRKVVNEMIREVVIHSSAEERFIYPLITKAKVGGNDGNLYFQRHATDHQTVKEILYFLDNNNPNSEQEWKLYNETVKKCMTALVEHMKIEEQETFPQLRKYVSDNDKLYDDITWAKENSPIHPHPSEPSPGSFAARLLQPLVGKMERAKEGM